MISYHHKKQKASTAHRQEKSGPGFSFLVGNKPHSYTPRRKGRQYLCYGLAGEISMLWRALPANYSIRFSAVPPGENPAVTVANEQGINKVADNTITLAVYLFTYISPAET